jgi:hypothetical protein
MTSRSTALGFAFVLLLLPACAIEPAKEDVGRDEAAYTGRIPEMTEIDRPPGAPDSWDQPDSEGWFNQYGYCGATAASNLLRVYGREVAPRTAIDDGAWSWIGTRPATLAAYLRRHHADLACALRTAPSAEAALSTLRERTATGTPVIVLFMTGRMNAHWVTVLGVDGTGDRARVLAMSWGSYYAITWSDLADAWRAGYGGPYPHIVCAPRGGEPR